MGNCIKPTLKPAVPTHGPVYQQFNDMFESPQLKEEHSNQTVTIHRLRRKMEHMERDYEEIQKDCCLLSNQANRNRIEKTKLKQENNRLKIELSILNNRIAELDDREENNIFNSKVTMP